MQSVYSIAPADWVIIFGVTLPQLRPIHYNQKHGILGSPILGVIADNFLTMNTRFSCFCTMAQGPGAKRWIFRQLTSRSRALPSSGIWCRHFCWVWDHVRRWMDALVSTPKHPDVNWVFRFHQYTYVSVFKLTTIHCKSLISDHLAWMPNSTVSDRLLLCAQKKKI